MNWNGLELPEAYYQDDAVYIIHADCREILPLIPDKSIDLVLTDPPYKVSGKRGVVSKEKAYKSLDETWDYDFEISQIAGYENMLVFCSSHLLPEYLNWRSPRQILHWHKKNAFPSLNDYYDWSVEYILWYAGQSYVFNRGFHRRDLFITSICGGNERLAHPTQKPEILFNTLLQVHSNPNQIILDPFLGSGTTAYCAKKLGRKCIGIEIEEKYCEIAAKRCSQSVMRLEL